MSTEEAKARITARNPLAGRLDKIGAKILEAENGLTIGVELTLHGKRERIMISELSPELVACMAAYTMKKRLLDAVCGTPGLVFNDAAGVRQLEAWRTGDWRAKPDARGKLAQVVRQGE